MVDSGERVTVQRMHTFFQQIENLKDHTSNSLFSLLIGWSIKHLKTSEKYLSQYPTSQCDEFKRLILFNQ